MNKRLVVFALAGTLLLSGCSLSKKEIPEQVIEPIITVSEEATVIGGFSISKSTVTAPSTEEEKEELVAFVSGLEGDNQVVIYNGESSATKVSEDVSTSRAQDQAYSKEIFESALKDNPMIQIYYCGSDLEEEKDIALYYPNVTYVGSDKDVDHVIATYYRANYVSSTCINGLRSGVDTVENFDLEGTIDSVSKYLPDVDKQDVLDGLETFGDYVANTQLFQKCETFSTKVEDALRPYVAAAIPKVESAWENAKPYIEEGKEAVGEIYEELKPGLSEAYEDAKGYVKSILGK